MSVIDSLELNIILEDIQKYSNFSLGKKRITNSKPSFDKLVIRQNNQRLKEALDIIIKYGDLPMPGMKDIYMVLEKCKKGSVLQGSECIDVLRFMQGVRSIISFKKTIKDIELDELDELFDTLTMQNKCEKALNDCFNEYGEVKDSASSELRRIRVSMRDIEGEISSAAQRFIQAHSDQVVDSIVTVRNGRSVILVRASDKNSFGGYVYGDSASRNASYVEPSQLVGLNNRKIQLIDDEQNEIQKILAECSKAIREVVDEVMANLDTCAILDEIFAKAKWGKEHNGIAGSLNDDKQIYLKKARHPLIDKDKVVSNTYRLGEDKKVLLITGPNTGGKTVSMKVIGLFVLMAYCGIPLLCEEASLPFVDNVFVDIGDDQSVVSSLSSFSAHIQKQAEVCEKATVNSLVLLDEVGSGTDPNEGEALAIAILNELRERGCLTICTTHYDRLKAYGKRHDDILLASVQFDNETLTPTYKYLEGLTGASNAFEIAEKYGLPKSIIKYARFLKEQSRSEEDDLIVKLEQQLNENVLKQEELNKQIEENKQLNEQLIKQQLEFQKTKDEYQKQLDEKANAYIEEVKKKANKVLKDIRHQQKTAKYHEALEKVSALNTLQNNEEEVEVDYDFKVGDAVELKTSSTVCEVIKVEKKQITILINGRQMRVKKNQIRPSLHIIPKQKKETKIQVRNENIFAQIPMEVNLIGLHVDEAINKMEDYMDTAMLHNLKTFRIIHGDGSGKLRQAVHQRLSKNKNVKSYRLGMPQEGGTGATVVTMK